MKQKGAMFKRNTTNVATLMTNEKDVPYKFLFCKVIPQAQKGDKSIQGGTS